MRACEKKRARTFSSSVARSNLRSSRHLLPNSSRISRCSSSSPRTGRREALFYFVLSARARVKCIALFLFIQTQSPNARCFSTSRHASFRRNGKRKRERERTASFSSSSSSSSSYLSRARAKPSEALDYDADAAFVFPEPPCLPRVFFRDLYFFTETLKSTVFLPFLSLRSEFRDYKSTPCASVTYTHTHHTKIGRAHVRTPVTEKSRMPSSA